MTRLMTIPLKDMLARLSLLPPSTPLLALALGWFLRRKWLTKMIVSCFRTCTKTGRKLMSCKPPKIIDKDELDHIDIVTHAVLWSAVIVCLVYDASNLLVILLLFLPLMSVLDHRVKKTKWWKCKTDGLRAKLLKIKRQLWVSAIHTVACLGIVLVKWAVLWVCLIWSFVFLAAAHILENEKRKNQREAIVASVATLLQNREPHHVFQEGSAFSLLYDRNGELDTMKGICPVGGNKKWLRDFRAALLQCTEHPTIEVRGLASVSPGHDAASYGLNLQVANLRTVSVATMLLADTVSDSLSALANPCRCEASFSHDPLAVADSLAADCEAARSYPAGPHAVRKLYAVEQPRNRGGRFAVRYQLWGTYEQVRQNRQVNDEGLSVNGENDRSALEFLNRSVQITILNDACQY